jgi:hypothetical protein
MHWDTHSQKLSVVISVVSIMLFRVYDHRVHLKSLTRNLTGLKLPGACTCTFIQVARQSDGCKRGRVLGGCS